MSGEPTGAELRWRRRDGDHGLLPRGPGRDALDGTRRYRLVRSFGFLVAGPLQLAFGSLFLLRPHSGTPGELAFGTGALVSGLAGTYLFFAPRERRAPTRVLDGRVLVPVRRGAPAAVPAFWTGVAVACVGMAQDTAATGGDDRSTGLVWFAPVFLLIAARAVWSVLRDRGHLRLDPEGVGYAGFHTGPRGAGWDDVAAVHLLRPRGRGLVLRLRDGATVSLETYLQAWHPRDIAALLTFYAEHPRHRGELADPRAVERRRDSLAASGDA